MEHLKKIRDKVVCHDYHSSYGLLFDKLTDVLALAKSENNTEAAYSEIAKDMFGQIAAMSQHCAEEIGLFRPQEVVQAERDTIRDNAIRLLADLLNNTVKTQMVIDNPHQKDSKIVVFNLDGDLLYEIDQFLNQVLDD
jgi:hypothetical protein